MTFSIAMTSNYVRSDGDPGPYLARIAQAGFTHVLWAHHAWSDFLYTEPEVRHIERCLRRCGLALSDLHCPTGKDKAWGSPVEYQRLAGVDIVRNRIELAARLGCDAVVMHVPSEPRAPAARRAYWRRQRRTMDALAPWALKHKVRMAMENTQPHNFGTLEKFFAICGPEVMGLCYDSGHGNVQSHGRCDALARLERLGGRVIDLHLHDNDAVGDLHWLPFTGTTDWQRLARILSTTAYWKRKNVIPIEAGIGIKDPAPAQEMRFLKKVAGIARRFGEMVEKAGQESKRGGKPDCT